MTTWVDVSTHQNLLDLLTLLENDTEIIILQSDQAVAKLSPVQGTRLPNRERQPNLHSGVWIRGDFNSLLPLEFWADKL